MKVNINYRPLLCKTTEFMVKSEYLILSPKLSYLNKNICVKIEVFKLVFSIFGKLVK